MKVLAAFVLYYTGLLLLWQRWLMRRRAVVLMYHRVLSNEQRAVTASHPAIIVGRATFARQMAALNRHFTVLSVEQMAEHLERKVPFPDRSAVITFDDGWRDNYTNALPILRDQQLPALVFLPAGYIGTRRLFWQEALGHLLAQVVTAAGTDPMARARLTPLLAPVGLAHLLEIRDGDPRPAVIAAVGSQKPRSRADIDRLIESLAAELGVNLDELARIDGFMDWAEVDAMGRHGVSFGGHGVNHLLLTQVSDEEADREIRGSREVLDDRFAGTVPTFSYPNGYVTSELVNKVKAAGFKLAFITRRGFVSAEDDPLTLRRLNIHETVTDSTPMFLARIVGLF